MALGSSCLVRFVAFSVFAHLLGASFSHSETLQALVFYQSIISVEEDFDFSLELNPICSKDSFA